MLKDRVREISTTTGTGTLTLDGAVDGFQSFAAIGNGNQCFYVVENRDEWEVGIGTYIGGMLTRDEILSSSNSGSKVNFSAGVKDVRNTFAAASRFVDVQEFTANGTWTKPPGAYLVEMVLIGGGGGGGSGRRGAAGTNRYGGGGGAGAGLVIHRVAANLLNATESVTIGTGGAGGAGTTSDDTNGNVGTIGGDTIFGNFNAKGGAYGFYGSEAAGTGGGGSSNRVINLFSGATNLPGAAGSNSNGATAGSGLFPPGGAGGGGVNATNQQGTGGLGAGGFGGLLVVPGSNPAGGSAGGGNGTDGADGSSFGMFPGRGGSGGGGNAAGPGGSGGNGGLYGAGGAGGGACVNGFTSGAGGNGAAGYALITTFCRLN